MTTTGRNFSGQVTPSVMDTEYIACNFRQPDCIDDGGVKKGVRLFPGDDTPRTFIRCNLSNCEPPPGSTCTLCNQAIRERNVYKDSDSVTIDGQSLELENYVHKTHGFIENGEYEYFDVPKETPVDRENE